MSRGGFAGRAVLPEWDHRYLENEEADQDDDEGDVRSEGESVFRT